MIEEFKYYFKHFFDFEIAVDIKKYKKQNIVSIILVVIGLLPAFFIFLNVYESFDVNESVNMSETDYMRQNANKSVFYAVYTFFVFLYLQFVQISNEIHRYNMRGKNWRKPLKIIGILFMAYIVLNIILYFFQQYEFMRLTIALMFITVAFWDGNQKTLESEKI